MAKSSCHKCGARLVEGAEICDLCGTLVPAEGGSVPDWIDVASDVGPAYRTIPDPGREASLSRPPAADPPVKSASDTAADRVSAGDWDQPSHPRPRIEPEENFFAGDGTAVDSKESTHDAEVVDGERPDFVDEEDFFSSGDESAEVLGESDVAVDAVETEMDRARREGSFEKAQVVEEEDFFSTGQAETSDAADDGPTEMQLAREKGSFERAEFVEPEDFFGSDPDDASGTPDALEGEDAPTEMDIARSGGSFERADVVEPEDFFADVPENDPPVETGTAPKGVAASGPVPPKRPQASRKQKKKRRQTEKKPAVPAEPQTNPGSAERAPGRKLSPSEVSAAASAGSGDLARGRVAATPSVQRPATDRQDPATQKAPSNRNAILVTAAAVLLTGGLFVVNSLSKQEQNLTDTPRPQMTAVSPIAPPPLSDEHEAEAQQLKNQIATLSGSRRISKQRELIALYSQERRFDLAAVVQQEIAEALNSEIEWIRSGNYYYDWMETQTGATKTDYAKLAIASYQRALDINPDNLDVRTNMALAYLYDPSNPMQAIRNTNLVLEKDPDHVLANFNRGVMLMQINRLDQAVEQFKRVQTLVGDPNDPVYQRAENAIQTIRQHRNQ